MIAGVSTASWPAWSLPDRVTERRTPMSDSATDFTGDPDPDAVLLMAVGQGDEAALGQLIERWKHPLINFFYRSIGSYETAEDLAQVVFVRLYRAASAYQPTAKFSTFLFHIARRLLINEFRRRSRKPAEATDPADLHASISGRAPLEMAEIEEAFQQALQDLPENQRTALLLLKQQELSYQQIAELMGASESAVKTWIFRARQHLKEVLRDVL